MHQVLLLIRLGRSAWGHMREQRRSLSILEGCERKLLLEKGRQIRQKQLRPGAYFPL